MAMTGEITLRGVVLPVGGIKEKILAASRAGVEEIILSEKNRKDFEEITTEDIRHLNVHFVRTVPEVLEVALLAEKVSKPIQFQLPEPAPTSKPQETEVLVNA
jgi:ATP-dependent Lon protease